MKRQNFKGPVVVSGIFFGTLLTALTAVFFQLAEPDFSWLDGLKNKMLPREQAVVSIPPLAGHWLRTAGDPAPEIPRREAADLAGGRPSKEYDAATIPEDRPPNRYMNRTTDNINIMYFWTDGPQLKVISVTSFNKKTRQAAIMVIPLHTRVSSDGSTLADLYLKEGRPGVKKLLEERLEISIPNFVHVNQEALRKLSDLIGSFTINGNTVTMADAFEQTAAGNRTDDREIVKAVGSRVLTPGIVLKVPKLLWIFTNDIRTNFSTDQMIQLFNLSRQMNLGEMRKITLPGTEYPYGGKPYLFVGSETWKNIIYDVTK
ncbi:MAG: LCP family protein [Bacillota bacterium]